MSSLARVSSVASGQYSVTSASSYGLAGNQSPDPAARENALTSQLDARLSEQISRIRGQITPISEPTSSGLGNVLDIRA